MIVGVLGGGQLGRMLALAGIPMGLQFRFLDPEQNAPAAAAGEHLQGNYDDLPLLGRFAAGLDVATYEFENVPADCVRRLAGQVSVYPPANALETAQDRLSEKRLFRSLDIPTAPFAPVDLPDDLESALDSCGVPAVLKTRRFGYDGKGQWLIREHADATAILSDAPQNPGSLILEGFVKFDREVSLIAARGRSGEIRFYPLTENRHEEGILRLSIAPASGVTPSLQQTAQSYVTRILEALDYVGVLAVEFFQCGDSLLANEIAPRVHNSGHWTIEGAETSQFENHVRAILGLPLGSCEARGCWTMWNILGTPPLRADVLRITDAHLHLYGKESRPGRKLGHISVGAPDGSILSARIDDVRKAAPQS